MSSVSDRAAKSFLMHSLQLFFGLPLLLLPPATNCHCFVNPESDIRKRRVSLIQAKHTRSSSKGTSTNTTKVEDGIIKEAENMKTALSAALPLSWSGEGDMASSSDTNVEDSSKHGESNANKVDLVYAAGIEMAELLMLAAQIMKKEKEKKIKREQRLQ